MTEASYPKPYGSYTLLERLGAGGMSEVDLARRTVGESGFVRFLVIKRIRGGNQVDDQYVRMFQDEARINAELSHENIAQVYDFGREGEEFYMAMEYVPGLDLRAVQIAMAKQGKLIPVRIALTILCGVLRALQYAHGRVDQLGRPMNIVHRDVNPRNIMLSVNGEVKLIDFGVAKAADRLERTEGNTVKGKFAYMAPEQIEANTAVDGRADLYAVALVLHELLTGRSPFAGLTEVQIMHRILSGKIPPLPAGIDHPEVALLQKVHTRGLSVRADARYRTADEMRADIEAALSPVGGPAPGIWIAELLREAAGEGVSDITRRLRAYREGAAAPPQRMITPPPPAESSGTLNVASIDAPPGRPAWIAWAAAGAGLSGGVLLALVLGGGGFAWWYLSQARPPAPPVVAGAPAPEDAAQPAPSDPSEPTAQPPAVAANPGPGVNVSTPSVVSGAARPQPSGAQGAPAGAPSGAPSPGDAPPSVPADALPSAPAPASPAPATEAAPAPTVAPPVEPAPAVAEVTPAASKENKEEPGYLFLTSRPVSLDVFLDGARIGATPIRQYPIPAGRHEIVVRNPANGRSDTQVVTVRASEVVKLPPILLE